MDNNFFPNRSLFWSFLASIVFLVGIIGYFLMDGIDYMRPGTISSSLSAAIYVILAAIFIVDSTLQVFSVYNISSYTHRYYAMVFSCVFDKVGSYAYFFGALFTATAYTTSNTIWICNTVGVCGFVVGAALNMMVPGSSILSSWANNLNLLGSILYLLAVLITRVPVTQIIAIVGDLVYLIDAIMYLICWFSDRQAAKAQGEQIALVTK